VQALRGLDLEVERGEVFGYLGPNGAGKTTTIRLLLDFIRPSGGRAVVLGGTGADPQVRRRMGYLPADLPVDPRWTAQDLIDFYGRLRGGVDPTWVGELLRGFDLDPARPVEELSTGNRRKVGIVQAVMHRRELLVLDEPSTGLDPLLRYEFQVLIRELNGAGTTVFLSSHVLPEVEALAGRVAILRRGELVTVAGVEELRRRPASASSCGWPVRSTRPTSPASRRWSRRRSTARWSTWSSRGRSVRCCEPRPSWTCCAS
jgi:beta-exotoxin I transport system ATP-binding protein